MDVKKLVFTASMVLVAGGSLAQERRSPAVCSPSFEIVEVSSAGGGPAQVTAVNDRGTVVGFADALIEDGGVMPQAFRWREGVAVPLQPPAPQGSFAYDVNDRGDVAGAWCAEECRAVLWPRDGVMQELGITGSFGVAEGLNDRRQVVGGTEVGPGTDEAFLWEDSSYTFLGTLGGQSSWALGVSRRGHVAGLAQVAEGAWHGFLWREGVMTDLGTLGGTESQARDLNSRAVVVGGARDASERTRPFRWREEGMQDLGTLPGDLEGEAFALNENGQTVGASWDAELRSRAILWQGGRTWDLNRRLSRPAGWTLRAAYDVSNRGWIVGSGERAGEPRAFLLQPTNNCH